MKGVLMISLVKNAGIYVSKLSNKIRRKLDMFSSRKEFSGSHGRTLHFLLAQNGDIFQKDIEEEFSIRPSTATEMLKQMEKNGLIVRQPVAYDNRLKKIVLTDKALKYKQQVIEDIIELEENLTKGISEDELNLFFKVIEKMMDNISE